MFTSEDSPNARLRDLRLRIIATLTAVTVIGFGSKYYTGPGATWANNSLAGAFYEIFWQLVVLFCAPRASLGRIALGVFLATCALEFLQLWHPPLLEAIRANFIGRTILGSTFALSDFPYYALGSLAGWGVLRRLRRNEMQRPVLVGESGD